ncbi:hypothetical protein H2136_20790 [Aeromonas hydrophila]|uniref:Lipoprotein n=1 Tax=Aeromonas hydrophila TaxID=644 RepID=A0A926IYD9_AERHY|nr:hypothetical protein [Aeromonas hydrophila]
MNKHILAITLASTLALTTGCSAVHTAVAKRNLDVQTKMSETIFGAGVSERKNGLSTDQKHLQPRSVG